MNYYFGQQHVGTSDFFDQLSDSGWYHTVPMHNSPHYQFVSGNVELYKQYLENSWNFYNISKDKIPDKIDQFQTLIHDMVTNQAEVPPIKIVERFDGKKIIYDGNHRVSIHLFHNTKLKIDQISLEDYVYQIVKIDDAFYGTKNGGIPYQSINFQGHNILKGRRNDIEERISLIKDIDLQGKSVVDFGCNLGMSLLPIFDRGATDALGVEVNKKIVTGAIRLNVLFALPIRYHCHNLALPLQLDKKYHTGFVFSVDQHVKNNSALASNIKNNVSDVVYFETHQNSSIPLEIKEIFDQIDLISSTKDNRHLYRCTIKND
jgi:2-polyprenyl-3-methyl-5-hydroxy-6-metoxy-1,4-benzoquinol methylase